MIFDIMAVHLHQDIPVAQLGIDCFMSHQHSPNHCPVVFPQSCTVWTLYKLWRLLDISFVCHHALVWILKNCYVRIFPSSIGAFVYTNQIALQNIQPELVPQRHPSIFVRGKLATSCHCSLLESTSGSHSNFHPPSCCQSQSQITATTN